MTIAKSIRQARQAIIGTLNGSGLPIDVMDMLLSEIQHAVHEQAEKEYREAEKKEAEAMELSETHNGKAAEGDSEEQPES